mgnify:CR=1 FL=1
MNGFGGSFFGVSVSDDGAAIDLEGRMTDSSVLADYLRPRDWLGELA